MKNRFIDAISIKPPLPEGEYFTDLEAVKALQDMGDLAFSADVTFFIGGNGSGKSTLMEAIAMSCGLNAEGGSKNFRFSSFNSHSHLNDYLTISRSA